MHRKVMKEAALLMRHRVPLLPGSRQALKFIPLCLAGLAASAVPVAEAFAGSSSVAGLQLRTGRALSLSSSRRCVFALPQLKKTSIKGLRMVATSPPTQEATIVGPKWKNDDEYGSLDAKELKSDLESVSKLIDELTVLSKQIDMDKLDSIDANVLVQMTRKSTDASVMLMNVATFASCEASVDGSNLEARSLQAKIRSMSSKMTQATQSAALAIKLAPDVKISEYLAQCPEEMFNVKHQRKLKDFTLSLAEENLITALSVDGNSAWSQLYTSISSTMSCKVGDKTMGVAQAAALLASPDRCGAGGCAMDLVSGFSLVCLICE